MVPGQQSRGSSLDGRRALSSSSAGGSANGSALPEPALPPAQASHLGAGDRSRSASHASLASSEGAATAGQSYAEKDAEGPAAEGVHRESSSDQLVSHGDGTAGAVGQQQQQRRSWWFGGGGNKGDKAEKRRERHLLAARPLLPAPFCQTRAKDDNLRLAVTVCAHSLPSLGCHAGIRLLCSFPAGSPRHGRSLAVC